jgi:hypothetical protein
VEQEQELPTQPLSSPLVFSGVHVFYVVFNRLLFVLVLLAIMLSLLRFTDSDYPFGIFKLFLPSVLDTLISSLKLLSHIETNFTVMFFWWTPSEFLMCGANSEFNIAACTP